MENSQNVTFSVQSLKNVLQTLGYGTFENSETLDLKTSNALQSFQNDYSLPIDGQLNDETVFRVSKIFNAFNSENSYLTANLDIEDDTARSKLEEIGEAITEEISERIIEEIGEAIAQSRLLKIGDTGEEVRKLQMQLALMGFYDGEINGNFDEDVEGAVSDFQQRLGVFVSKFIDAQTLDALEEIFRGVDEVKEIKRPVLKIGETGDYVKTLQTILRVLGIYNGESDGKFGNSTRKAVLAFQNQNNLADDGIVGPKTWSKLYEKYNMRLNFRTVKDEETPENYAPKGDLHALKEGATGEEVALLQDNLKRNGYFFNNSNGHFNAQTAASVRAFQRDHGISPTGVVDEITWQKM